MATLFTPTSPSTCSIESSNRYAGNPSSCSIVSCSFTAQRKQLSFPSPFSSSSSSSICSSRPRHPPAKPTIRNEYTTGGGSSKRRPAFKKHSFGSKTHLLFPRSSSKEDFLRPVKSGVEDERGSGGDAEEKSKASESRERKELILSVSFPSFRVQVKGLDREVDTDKYDIDNIDVDQTLRLIMKRLPAYLHYDITADEIESMFDEIFRGDLDLDKLKSAFGFDTFFATGVRRYRKGGIFTGNLRRPIEEVIPKLEKKLSEAVGKEVFVYFREENNEQVCVVQPKADMNQEVESTNMRTWWGYLGAVSTFGTTALLSSFFLKPDATWYDYIASVVPLFGGFSTIFGVSEIATRVTAARYGVKLGPSFLVPSYWTGCLGVMNDYESLPPNNKALFDISVARTASAYITSLILAIAVFVANGSFNGGDNALYISPEFFDNNPLLSFVQFVIGHYTDDLGNVSPFAIEGVGVPVDPLAFAGLLGKSSKIFIFTGMVVTSLNLLPCGRLEGGRIARAMLGESSADLLSLLTSFSLLIAGLRGNALCLAWVLFSSIFRGEEEVVVKDEITPLRDDRFGWGVLLGMICFVILFPSGQVTFPNSFFSDRFFGDNF
ncbi:putative zinc metallopeptidase egy3, chloroplastic [Turnera subulata]|uniref:Zinc metallopeptidase egy3, chloroplastic n=1 Tax=Turnera subulata TaxID=218843 RepID=A0A9Q0F445_9ROSI|nr:putative zinc metallopeptidase egy3, chloroplastic [Turnera subulata]